MKSLILILLLAIVGNSLAIADDTQARLETMEAAREQSLKNNNGSSAAFFTENCPQQLDFWKKAAGQGYAVAQLLLGGCYDFGQGVGKNLTEALAWYRKAAEQGNIMAQYNLGIMYLNGEGNAKDSKQSLAWLQKAAEHGHLNAQFNLGVIYSKGDDGIAKNEAQAAEWFRKAAEQSHVGAQFNLGLMYTNGEGVAKDENQALAWLQKAAAQGHAKAQAALQEVGFGGKGGAGNADHVQLLGEISQTLLPQHGDNHIYLLVTIKAPTRNQANVQPPRSTDMVIVLDRSGSMQAENKINFAKAAIHDVLAQLTARDTFALVSFANHAIVHAPSTAIDAASRENLKHIVDTIPADGGTNMGEGLQSALHLLEDNKKPERIRKVLLLSDGQANRGISDPPGLAAIAGQITKTDAVLSTIGMGLDFNESLLATLADNGMGHYSYLEHLSGLGEILAKDLLDTRNIHATASTLDVTLGKGVALLDAGGYPVTPLGADAVRITTGQILDNTDKRFVVTFTLPTQQTATLPLAQLQLHYQTGNGEQQAPLAGGSLQVEVIAASRRDEALRSMNGEVYKKVWAESNLGQMKKAWSDSVRAGDKAKARQVVADYRQALQQAEKGSDMRLLTPEVEGELKALDKQLEESFAGDAAEQDLKRKRWSKSMQKDGIYLMRK